ncbi:hypothetical protein RB195_014386 [Necator americanus]|uniref:Uncharacterized protein n=1 Tax=Necator americanus TaxID=51031 RepID=A0ABR1DZT0_NECAM
MTPPWSLVCLAVTITAVSSQYILATGDNEKRNDFSRDIMHFGKRSVLGLSALGNSNPDFDRDMMSFGKRTGLEREFMSFGKRSPTFLISWNALKSFFNRNENLQYEREFLPFGKRDLSDFNREMMSFGKREDFDRNIMPFGRRRR